MSEWRETDHGKIPINWDFIKASAYCVNVTDGTHDSPKQQNEGKYLITSKHIKGRNIDFENAYLISVADFNKINERSRVDQWDVIISMIGEYCGFAYVERNNTIDYAIKNVGLFKTGNKDRAIWLYYYIQSKIGRNYLDSYKSGTSQPYITLGTLREFPILVPKREAEQKAIASILSSLDDKLDLLHRQNATLEAMAETLFRQWFVEEAKEEWGEKSLLEVIELIGGGTPKTDVPTYWNGNVKWLSGGDIASNHKRFIVDAEKSITELGLKSSSAKLLPMFSTVISARGTVGKYCLLSEPMVFSQSNYGIKPRYSSCYFFTYLLVAFSVDELQAAAYGSVFDTITTTTFKEHFIKLPDDEKIFDFERIITPHFEKMLSNVRQIRTLTTLRDSLLPKLMSGEIKIEHKP